MTNYNKEEAFAASPANGSAGSVKSGEACFHTKISLKPGQKCGFDAHSTGVAGFASVDIQSNEKLSMTTSSGAFSFNAVSVSAEGVELLDITVKNIGQEPAEISVTIKGGF